MKRTKKQSFNINEDEAELFLSLKNAFSSLAIDEEGENNSEEQTDVSSINNSTKTKLELRDHERFAEEINPDELAARVKTAFLNWEKTLTSPHSVPGNSPLSASLEQGFTEIETDVMCVTEAAEYLMSVLGSSKKTVESLGKITEEYVKGWSLVEMIPEIRYRYCLMTDKLGAKWLDVLLEFSQLSVENRTEWLNKFMHNWSHASGAGDLSGRLLRPSGGNIKHPYYNDAGGGDYGEDEGEEEDYSYLDEIDKQDFNTKGEDDARDSGCTNEATSTELGIGKGQCENQAQTTHCVQTSHETPVANNICNLERDNQRLKRGRSSDDMEDMEYVHRGVVEDSKGLHKRLQWEFVKNMQLMGSMRFELCKKCGMKEDCLRIAQQMNDREKIVESRLMSGDAGDEVLNEAMNSLLHL